MNREQALKFTEKELLPTILVYWTDKTLKGMTIEAKEALQKLWKEHIRPGTTYMISCPDCPAMGLDTIGAWYCKAHGFPPSVAVIQAGIDGTLDELKAARDVPVLKYADGFKKVTGSDPHITPEGGTITNITSDLPDPFAKLPVPEVKDNITTDFIPPPVRPAVKDDQPTKHKK